MRMISCQLSGIADYDLPPLAEALSTSASPAANNTCQDTFLYPHFQQNILDFTCGRSPTSGDKNPSQTKFEFATVISPPRHQHSRTRDFSSSSSSPLSSSTPESSSCSTYFTNCSPNQNHLYQHHNDHNIEVPQQQYSTESSRYFVISDNSGHFLNTNNNTIDTSINGSGNITTNSPRFNLVSDPHTFCTFKVETDVNNNNSNISANTKFRDLNIFDNNSTNISGKISPAELDRKIVRLPPFEVLLSNSPGKQGQLELNQQMMRTDESVFDENDDSDINLRTSLSNMEEETHYTDLTNVGQASNEHGHNYVVHTPEINFEEWPMNDPYFILKPEPHDDYDSGEPMYPFTDYDEPNIDPSTPDSDGYDSSSTDRVPFGQFCTTANTAANVPYTYRSNEEALFFTNYSGHESSSSSVDEGFGEGNIIDVHLPHFEQLKSTEKVSQRKRNNPLNCKEKKKTVRESLPYIEKERRKPGRKPGQVSNVLHLWEFMRDLLHSSENQGIIEWISKSDGVFRVMNSTEVARLWGAKKKNKKIMTYEKLSRSLRYSRLEGYFADLPRDKNYPKKLCFKFGPKSKDWH